MANVYKRNHYVPKWYQKRFIDPLSQSDELYYLDLNPTVILTPTGIKIPQDRPSKRGPKYCFVQDDLYTTNLESFRSTDIEQYFFGPIDLNGKSGVELLAESDHRKIINNQSLFEHMRAFMGVQKLRTPKGLEWLRLKFGNLSRDESLRVMMEMRHLHSTMWLEGVWQIVDATSSETKFIISDHPVTVYNRGCKPRSKWCEGVNDPEVWQQATHTLFPLSSEKLLIITNRSWARNPYQSETAPRPNANPFRVGAMPLLDIQFDRKLSEYEVRQINFIIKNRAHRFIAAGRKEWLYPEEFVSPRTWHIFGDGYLLMPDPRALHGGGTMTMGWDSGRRLTLDDYGRTPDDPDFERESNRGLEYAALNRFKGEFARLFGPGRRGRDGSADGGLSTEIDSAEMHRYHLDRETPSKREMRDL